VLCLAAFLSVPVGNQWLLPIVAMLVVTAGLPCLALAGTSTLIQTWFGRSEPERSPYLLYSLSNVASLGALLLAPTLFESWFSRQQQTTIWGALFMVYTIGICAAGWRAARLGVPTPTESVSAAGDARNPVLLWLLLPFCSSVLLLSLTNQLSQEVSVVPFLWSLPLAIYLLTFILAFDHPRWYPRRLVGRALPIVLGLIWAVLFFSRIPNGPGLRFQLVAYCVALFVTCLFCHAELYRLRPGLEGLSRFYLCISAGDSRCICSCGSPIGTVTDCGPSPLTGTFSASAAYGQGHRSGGKSTACIHAWRHDSRRTIHRSYGPTRGGDLLRSEQRGWAHAARAWTASDRDCWPGYRDLGGVRT
jgi:hypothetical protein